MSASAAKGFTISTNSSKAFGVIVEGAIKGLGFGLNYVLSSSTSYTVTNNVYNMAHIGCRVVYEVEKGTRVYYNAQNNKELGRNAYTYKKPKTIEYDLIKVY
ncbi:hypothetical protein [Peptostreptococcus sp. D1]|uniref:hypothetical protein n=1 Tax=Peptostreptococcus sp. D1 TaxID=72304 RepID=UPI0008F3DABC|nr:hypothetical protein [Peptostreptococcus sp. D1]SFE93647.1 hypothetical protein SAMN02910278_02110 [Peptostreptococcus sp. D1]